MRIALHSELHDGSVGDYLAHHARIPDELSELFARAGVHDWTIWRSGTRLFHLVDCDDWQRAVEMISNDAANLRWQAAIGRFVSHFLDADGQASMGALEQVWSLSNQRANENLAP